MHYYLQVMLLSLVCASPLIAQTPVGPIGRQIPVPVEQQDWQARRAQSLKIILAAKAGDPGASSAMNALLAEYETHALSATPMENLDVLGLFYVPRDGVEKCLPAVVLNCALGWYDALRFGSASGRAEIAENEGFFGRAYSLGGGAIQQDAGKFVMENPDKVMKLVEEGLGSAEKSRDTKSYDRRWPTAYGLELIIAAQGGKSEGKILPEGEWDKAWEEAKVRVRTYYGLSESGGSLVSKYFTDPEAASLAEAVASGDTAKIDRMLERGIDLNATGRGGVTPLFWALVKHNKKSFDDLLVHGANPNIQLTEAYGAVGPGNSVMSVAAMNQDIWFLQEVLRHGGDPNLVNSTRSQTPLVASLSSQQIENAKLLVFAGANLNWKDRNGETPLMLAATFNEYEAVFAMLNAGADPAAKNRWGQTVVNRIKKGRTDPNSAQGQWKQKVIDLLKGEGVDFDIPDSPRRTLNPSGAP